MFFSHSVYFSMQEKNSKTKKIKNRKIRKIAVSQLTPVLVLSLYSLPGTIKKQIPIIFIIHKLKPLLHGFNSQIITKNYGNVHIPLV